MEQILNVLGANGYDARCQVFTKQYLTIILCGIPFYMFSTGMASVIRASGAPMYSMISTVVGAVINLIFDPIIIFGFEMGIKGAAIATIAGQIVSACLCAVYFIKPKLINLNKESFKIDGKVLGKLLKLGISSFITQISIAIITIVANNVVGTIGGENATDAGGALGIVFKVFAIVISFSVGVAVGGQPIIGFNYGAKQYKRVLETYKIIVIVNIVIGFISMILFESIPGAIVSLFGGHANDLAFYQEYACLSFRIYLGGIIFCCIQKASCIFLQSIDRPYKAMILSLMRDVIILVPGVCILGLCGNLYTMLWAGPISDIGAFIVTVILVSIECKKISKLSNEVPDNINQNVANYSRQKFVISRCSDFILKNKPNVITIFIYASDMDFKINRKKELEKIDIKEAKKKIIAIDKQRAEYYKHFTLKNWGDKNNYEICIDTSKIGVEETIDLLENYIIKRKK